MKEIRDVAGNFLGFEGSTCVAGHDLHIPLLGPGASDDPMTFCEDCGIYCSPSFPCPCCFAAWRAENERYRRALEEIADAPFSWARSTLWDIARQALEEKG